VRFAKLLTGTVLNS